MMYLLITRKYIGAQNNAAQKNVTPHFTSVTLCSSARAVVSHQSRVKVHCNPMTLIVDWAMLHALGLVTGNRFLIPKKSGYLSDDSPMFTLCMEKITMTSDNRVKNFFHC